MGIKKGIKEVTKKPVSGGPGGFKPTTGGPMKPTSDGPSEGD
jgi:hypothetical protein